MTNGNVKTVVFSMLAMILSVEECTSDPRISAVNKSCDRLTVQWTAREGVDIYQVQYRPTTQTGGWQNKFTNETIFEITDLLPNTTYTVRIKSITGGSRSLLTSGDFTLLPDTGPQLTVTSRSARVVSILPVVNRAGKSVHRCTLTAHYTFNTSESGGLYRVTFYTTSQGLNISSLLPDTDYSLVCTALLPVHGCTSSFTQFTFKTLPWVTSQVRVGNSFLQNNHLYQSISWRRPPHHTSQLNYIVKYGPSSVVDRPKHPSVNTTTSSNTTVILTLPIPTTPVVYNVWVAAVSDGGQGEYSRRKQVHYTTPMTAPTPIILVNKTCNAIILEWGAPPSTGGLPVLKYTLKISDNLQHSYINVTSPTATLRQMEPNTKYTLAVRAVNFIGHSEWTKSVMVTTLKRDGQSMQILKVTPNEIQVSINRRVDKHDYNCTIKDTHKIIALSVSDGVTFAIPNLSPNTTYDIDCIGAEDQCLEVNITVTTTATVPSEPTNAIVSQTTHNSAQIKWSVPLQKGGSEIIGYKITFTSLKHSGHYIIGVINTWKLVGLVPDSKYNIEISAINRVGIGAPANLTAKTSATVERGRDTVNVTVSEHGTKVQCGLRDSGQEHSTNTSILLSGHSSVFPLLSRGTDHTLSCTNKGTQCTGLELTVTVPSCP